MLLWYIYITLIGLCVLTATLRWKFLCPAVKVISVLTLWVFIIELLRHFGPQQAIGLMTHINLEVEVISHFIYFYILLQKKRRPVLYGGAAFFTAALFLSWNNRHAFFIEKNYLDAVFLAVCMTFWCGLFFYELIHKPLQYSLKLDGNFWINCGNILFYPGTLMILGLNSYLENTPHLLQNLKPISYVLNLVLYTLYLVAFVADRKQAIGTDIAKASERQAGIMFTTK